MKKEQTKEIIVVSVILVIATIALFLGTKLVEQRTKLSAVEVALVRGQGIPKYEELEFTDQITNLKINTEKQAFLTEGQIQVKPANIETIAKKVKPVEPEIGSYEWFKSLSELEQMARLIYAESGGESNQCQRATGIVVMNRITHWFYKAGSIADAVYQKGQYACTWDGNIKKTPSERAYENAIWVLNGNRIIELDNGKTLYMGSDFTYQGPKQGYNCLKIGSEWFGTYSNSDVQIYGPEPDITEPEEETEIQTEFETETESELELSTEFSIEVTDESELDKDEVEAELEAEAETDNAEG